MKLIKGWKDLNVGTYQKILTNTFNPEDPDGIYVLTGLIYGLSKEEVMELPLAETQSLIKSIEFLQTKPRPIMIKREYDLGGKKYILQAEVDEITTAQYIDFNNTPKSADNMAELLAIFLIPKGKTYNKGYDYREAVQDIEDHLSVSDALAISDFFTFSWRLLMQQTTSVAKKALKQAKKDGAITKQEQKEIAEKLDKLADMSGSITLKK